MGLVGDISVRLGLEVKDFQKGLETAEKSMAGVGKGLSDVGKSLAKRVTLPLVGLGVAGVKVGAEFEQSMARVQAVSGATGKEFASLEAEALRLGESTRFSASESAEGMSYLAMAGFEASEVLDSMGDVLNLASIGQMDLGTTADIASNMLSGMGMDAGDLDVIVDQMAYTMANANTDIQGLGDAFAYVAPTASMLDVDLAELNASIGILGDSGMQGGQAGRMIANGLTRLASPTDEATELLERLGVEAFDAEGHLKKIPDVIGELERGFEDLNPQEQAEALSVLFGLENMKGWTTLIGSGGEAIKDFADDIRDAEGAGQDMSDIMNDTFLGDFDAMWSMIQSVGIEFYRSIEQPLRDCIQAITGFVKSLKDMDGGTKQVVMALIGVAVVLPIVLIAVGTLIALFSKAVGVVKSVVTGIQAVVKVFNIARTAVMALSGPIGWTILAITALVAVGIVLYKNWDTIKEKATKVWDSIKNIFSDTFNAIKGNVIEFKDSLLDNLSKAWDTAVEGVSDFLTSIKDWFSETWESVKEGTLDILNNIIDGITEWGSEVYEATGLKDTVELLIAVWEFLRDTIEITTEMIVAVVQTIFSRMAEMVMPYVDMVIDFIIDAWDFLVDKTTTAFSFVKDLAVGLWEKVVEVWEGIKSATIAVYDYISEKIKSVWRSILRVVVPIVTGMWNKIKGVWDKLKTVTKTIFEAVKTTLYGIWDDIKKKVVDTVTDIYEEAKNKFEDAKKAITEPIGEAKETIKGYIEDIKSFFTNLVLKIPLPKVPKFSVSRGTATFMGAEIPVPKFDVSWNAKGNIFTGASLLGGGQGVGEAGAEVVMPIQHKRYMRPYAQVVAELLDDMDGNNKGQCTVHNEFKIAKLIVREEADIEKIAEKLEEIQKKQQRARGVFAY